MANIKRNVTFITLVIAIVCIGAASALLLQSRLNVVPQLIASHAQSTKKQSFPHIDTASLSISQQKIVTVLQTEYAHNPSGTKYSQGIEEAWCADFVSWVFNEAGVPLSNPNSGSWHIPGTFTLREYYESIGKLHLASSQYSPKVGDIMLYDNPSPFGQHTNIVIDNKDGIITTIGGNEPGGIRVVKHIKKDDAGFIGYGEL